MIEDIDILLVEDSAADQEMTMRTLQKRHVSNRVHIVGDGAEALDFLFGRGKYEGRTPQHAPKVMLLDIKLPKMNGIEVLRAVKGHPEFRSMPVVMLTSSREEPDILECYGLGVNSYIVKPVDFDQFSDAVAGVGLYWLILNEPPPPGARTAYGP